MSAAEIHLELGTLYGQNETSEGTVRQWCRMFKDGRKDVRDEERSGRPAGHL
jgi:transposase